MDALIVGAGAVGRWFGECLEWPLAFGDVDPATATAAADAVGDRARTVDLDTEETVDLDTEETFDLVVVAVPMTAAVEAIHRHAGRAERAVLDLTGSMARPLEAIEEAAPELERCSLHPLFAPEHAPGRVAIATENAGPVTGSIREALADRGNSLVEVAPTEHDRAMRTIQGRAHAAILAFGLAAEDVPADLQTPVHEQLTALLDRVTGGNPRIYADIQETFDGAADVAEAAERLADADSDRFEALYEDAG
ncbi:MAG: prephenate dehydrogenase [Halodesulfurarchaeum sp.]